MNFILIIPTAQGFFFIVETATRKYVMRAASEDDRATWLSALEEVLSRTSNTVRLHMPRRSESVASRRESEVHRAKANEEEC